MSLYLTDTLGPKVDSRTGRWVPNSESWITGLSGAMSQRRLLVAQISDLYLVRWYLEVTSASVAGGHVTPQVNFWSYGDTGNGTGRSQRSMALAAVDALATSSAWMMIRAAASDIFISTVAGSAGVPPTYNLYVSISRPS